MRTTVRNLERKPEVYSMLKAGGAKHVDKLEFTVADLNEDSGWPEAVKDCNYVLHVASPFPLGVPKHEDDLIIPAREGTLRVLHAARNADVNRVVMTSSFAAIGYGNYSSEKVFTEKDWSNSDGPGVSAYVKSKTLAERAAWDFISSDDGSLELATVNPVGVFGPVFGKDISTSIQLVQRIMAGSMPGCPQLQLGVVDVRDVADLHLRAMTNPAAKNERFLAVSGDFMMVQEMAETLRNRMGHKASKIKTNNLPNFFLRLVSLFDPEVRLILPELGQKKGASSAKACNMLGWAPMSREDALVATAESLIKFNMVKV